MPQRGKEGRWTLLTSHGHVLVEVARNPEATIRELADAAEITERATLMIVADLVDAGYLTRKRVGRRNRYELHLDRGFRHASQRDLRVGPFLDLLTEGQLSQAGMLYLARPTAGPSAGDGDRSPATGTVGS